MAFYDALLVAGAHPNSTTFNGGPQNRLDGVMGPADNAGLAHLFATPPTSEKRSLWSSTSTPTALSVELNVDTWRRLRSQIESSDVAVLNSGHHDVAPLIHKHSHAYYGQKRAPSYFYRRRLRVLFSAISEAGLNRRVVWRLTTFPHALSAPSMQSNPKFNYPWYTRCDVQHMRLDLIQRMNLAARALANEYRIPVLDFSPLVLSAGATGNPLLVKDYVHPAPEAAKEWVQVFAQHRLVGQGGRKREREEMSRSRSQASEAVLAGKEVLNEAART